MLAAIAARGPDSQIVTSGRSSGSSAAPSAMSRYGCSGCRDVAGVALVPLADVDQLGTVGEDVLELVDTHELERLRPPPRT